jgi:hypothetical protein
MSHKHKNHCFVTIYSTLQLPWPETRHWKSKARNKRYVSNTIWLLHETWRIQLPGITVMYHHCFSFCTPFTRRILVHLTFASTFTVAPLHQSIPSTSMTGLPMLPACMCTIRTTRTKCSFLLGMCGIGEGVVAFCVRASWTFNAWSSSNRKNNCPLFFAEQNSVIFLEHFSDAPKLVKNLFLLSHPAFPHMKYQFWMPLFEEFKRIANQWAMEHFASLLQYYFIILLCSMKKRMLCNLVDE